jgi:chromosome partitioning protein
LAVVSFVNQKGGTAKTTSAVNVVGWLTLKGKNVLLVDLDPQAHATNHVTNVERIKGKPHIGSVLLGNKDFQEAIYETEFKPSFHFVPSSLELSLLEYQQGGAMASGLQLFNLREKLRQVVDNYDYIIFDCPPNLGFFTTSALIASNYVIVPLEPEPMAFDGLSMLTRSIIPDIMKKFNTSLNIGGILLTKVDERRILTQKIREDVLRTYPNLKFDQEIHVDVKLAEAAAAHKPICFYSRSSKGSQEYEQVTEEFISRISTK